MDPVLVTQKIIILNPEGKFLAIRRSHTDSDAFAWDLPGGLIEKGEDIKEAILREIQEEVAVEISDLKILDVFSASSKQNPYFICVGYVAKADSTDVTLSWEHDQYEWVTKEEFLERPAKEHIKELVRRL
jgi:8-oxo-dGTP diphosphatase